MRLNNSQCGTHLGTHPTRTPLANATGTKPDPQVVTRPFTYRRADSTLTKRSEGGIHEARMRHANADTQETMRQGRARARARGSRRGGGGEVVVYGKHRGQAILLITTHRRSSTIAQHGSCYLAVRCRRQSTQVRRGLCRAGAPLPEA